MLLRPDELGNSYGPSKYLAHLVSQQFLNYLAKQNLPDSDWLRIFYLNDRNGLRTLVESTLHYVWSKRSESLNELFDDLYPHDTELFIRVLVGIVFPEIRDRVSNSVRHLVDSAGYFQENEWIVFVGAGVSFESDLGHNTIHTCLANCISVDYGEIEEEYRNDGLGYRFWEDIRTADSVDEFRTIFESHVISFTSPSETHDYIYEKFTEGRIGHLICFNWDDLIERDRQNELPISVGLSAPQHPNTRYWKPHGSIAYRDIPWILPDEETRISDALRQRLSTDRPARIVISLGFRGSPNFSVQHVRELVGNVMSFDIRPQYSVEEAIGTHLISLSATMFVHWLKSESI